MVVIPAGGMFGEPSIIRVLVTGDVRIYAARGVDTSEGNPRLVWYICSVNGAIVAQVCLCNHSILAQPCES